MDMKRGPQKPDPATPGAFRTSRQANPSKFSPQETFIAFFQNNLLLKNYKKINILNENILKNVNDK
jgi:hypothetical protein